MWKLVLVRFNLTAPLFFADDAAKSSRCWPLRMMAAARRLILAFVLGGLSISAAAQEPLFERTGERLLADSKHGVEAVERIRVNTTLLRIGERFRVLIPLPSENVIVTLSPLSPKTINLPASQQAWRGTIDDKVGGSVFLLRGRDFIRGQITRKGRIYVIRSVGERREVLEVIDPERAFPDDHPRDVDLEQFHTRRSAAPPKPPALADCDDPIDQVDVMVLYTPAARIAAGGTISIEAEVAFAVVQANLAYLNSNVFHRLNLVHTGEVNYTEPSGGISLSTALTALRSTIDSALNEVHALRDTHKADLVSLLVESPTGGSGLGYNIEPPDSTEDGSGFSVVRRTAAATNYSLAHEIGHNMSANHDRANVTRTPSVNYGYGHIQPIPSTSGDDPWRTVMSYNQPCETQAGGTPCTRIPYFSNPAISRSGDPTGVALTAPQPEHNVQAMADADSVVARFRCRTSSTNANVWMKDRWDDAGVEPDPATAGEPMWQSPYIWVRNNQDTALTYQHDHQNPELDATNYVYVKMHNDGIASASGALELYWASAATNLNDPANWSLIASRSVSSLSSGTSVIEFPWSSLPGTGHFCLMARWNESGTPLAFTNLNTAVRNSNDMIWRNVEIIDLAGDADDEYVIVVRGTSETQETWLLFTGRVMNGREVPWKDIASLKLHLDGNMDHSILKGEGLQQIGPDTFELSLSEAVASLGPLRLGKGEELKVLVKPSVNSELVAKARDSIANNALFEVNVMQALGDALKHATSTREGFRSEKPVLGGVTYQVRLPPRRRS